MLRHFLEDLPTDSLLCSVAYDSVTPQDCSLRVSVYGTSQASILEWVAISSSRRSSQQPRDRTHVDCIGRRTLCP